MTKPGSLMELLRWAGRTYELETPNLEHTVSQTDAGGAPEMKPAATAWLGLHGPRGTGAGTMTKLGRTELPDDWGDVACRLDKDGFNRTPLRCAISRLHDAKLRDILNGLVANVLFPRDVLVAYGYTEHWEQDAIAGKALTLLYREYAKVITPQRGRRSDSQLNAEAA